MKKTKKQRPRTSRVSGMLEALEKKKSQDRGGGKGINFYRKSSRMRTERYSLQGTTDRRKNSSVLSGQITVVWRRRQAVWSTFLETH